MSDTHPNISPRALKLLKYLEGLRLSAYRDEAGIWTIGYGHTGNVREGQRITAAQADVILLKDLDFFEALVWKNCPGISQDAFDAAVLLAFNIGPGRVTPFVSGFVTSTACKLLRQKDYAGAAAAMKDWNKVQGYDERGKPILVKSNVLVRRRALEARVMLGDFPFEVVAP